MKMPFNTIAIDIETTDLDPSKGDIIQLSAILINENFDIAKNKEFNLYIQTLTNYRNPAAMSVNKIDEETIKTGYNLNDALELFESFCEDNKILASWGNYFDIPFLYRQYKKINRKWPFNYKSIDLKSIAIFEMAKRDKDASGGVQRFLEKLDMTFIGTPHNALDDITNSIRILQQLKVE